MIRSRLFILFTVCYTGIAFSQNQNIKVSNAAWVGTSLQGAPCTGSPSTVGPLDYSNPAHRRLHVFSLIEGAHFNSRVEQLIAGAKVNNKDRVVLDINYTLKNVPNHHRALNSMIRFQLEKREDPISLKKKNIPPVECYLQRAVAFSPKDAKSHMLFGMYLHRKGLLDQALISYQKAKRLHPEDPEIQYNIGLIYLDLNKPTEALAHAKRAYDLGYPLPGLRKRLQAAGVWQ